MSAKGSINPSQLIGYNLDATRDPLPTDDYSAGYRKGAVWVNKSDPDFNKWAIFFCADAANGTAIWKKQGGDLLPYYLIKSTGNVPYYLLQDAITAATAGETVIAFKDTQENLSLKPGVNVNLNGFDLILTGAMPGIFVAQDNAAPSELFKLYGIKNILHSGTDRIISIDRLNAKVEIEFESCSSITNNIVILCDDLSLKYKNLSFVGDSSITAKSVNIVSEKTSIDSGSLSIKNTGVINNTKCYIDGEFISTNTVSFCLNISKYIQTFFRIKIVSDNKGISFENMKFKNSLKMDIRSINETVVVLDSQENQYYAIEDCRLTSEKSSVLNFKQNVGFPSDKIQVYIKNTTTIVQDPLQEIITWDTDNVTPVPKLFVFGTLYGNKNTSFPFEMGGIIEAPQSAGYCEGAEILYDNVSYENWEMVPVAWVSTGNLGTKTPAEYAALLATMDNTTKRNLTGTVRYL